MRKLIIPGLPIGLFLYLNKRYHLFNPIIVFPVLIIVPILIYYVLMAATGESMDTMAEELVLLASRSNFWEQFVSAYGGLASGKIQW